MIKDNDVDSITIQNNDMILSIQDAFSNSYFEISLSVPHLKMNLLGYFTPSDVALVVDDFYDFDYNSERYEKVIKSTHIPTTLGVQKIKETTITTWKTSKTDDDMLSWEMAFVTDTSKVIFKLSNHEMENVLRIFFYWSDTFRESIEEPVVEVNQQSQSYAVVTRSQVSQLRHTLATSLTLENAKYLANSLFINDDSTNYYVITDKEERELQTIDQTLTGKVYPVINIDNEIINDMRAENIREEDFFDEFASRSSRIHAQLAEEFKQQQQTLYNKLKTVH